MRGRSALAALGVTGCGLVVGLGEFVPAGDPGSVDDGGKNDGTGATVAEDAADAHDETDGAGDAKGFSCPAKVDAAHPVVSYDFEKDLPESFVRQAFSVDLEAGCPPGSLLAHSASDQGNWASVGVEGTRAAIDLDVLIDEGGSGRVAQISFDFKHYVQVEIVGTTIGLREELSGDSNPTHGGPSEPLGRGWFHAYLDVNFADRTATLIVNGHPVAVDAGLSFASPTDGGISADIGLEVGNVMSATSVHLDNVVIQHF